MLLWSEKVNLENITNSWLLALNLQNFSQFMFSDLIDPEKLQMPLERIALIVLGQNKSLKQNTKSQILMCPLVEIFCLTLFVKIVDALDEPESVDYYTQTSFYQEQTSKCREYLRWSTCVLVYFNWLLDHVIYLNQAEKSIIFM